MKTILSLRRHHYAAAISIFLIFLITVALIAGMVGCGGGGPYDLMIVSTAGGEVTTPQQISTYAKGTVVNLVAVPDTGYHFKKWIGDIATIADVDDATTTITMSGHYLITAYFAAEFMVATGYLHAVGLKSDGTVVAVGDNTYGQCDVGNWTGIVQAAVGDFHTVGLKSDGTVVAVGWNVGQCDVEDWANIVQVAAGHQTTVGLKSDGTVVAAGFGGGCDVFDWTDIIQVAAGYLYTVGVKSDGSVVAVGENHNGQCEVSNWTDIIQVAAGDFHTVGLKADGTMVAVGIDWGWGRRDLGSLVEIVQVAATRAMEGGSTGHTVVVKSNGTVVAMGNDSCGQCEVDSWMDIVQVAASPYGTLGLKSDGTVVATEDECGRQWDVSGWMLK